MVELTEGELLTIHRLYDYIISKREHFNIVASGKDGIIARAEALDEKVSKILWPGDST